MSPFNSNFVSTKMFTVGPHTVMVFNELHGRIFINVPFAKTHIPSPEEVQKISGHAKVTLEYLVNEGFMLGGRLDIMLIAPC